MENKSLSLSELIEKKSILELELEKVTDQIAELDPQMLDRKLKVKDLIIERSYKVIMTNYPILEQADIYELVKQDKEERDNLYYFVPPFRKHSSQGFVDDAVKYSIPLAEGLKKIGKFTNKPGFINRNIVRKSLDARTLSFLNKQLPEMELNVVDVYNRFKRLKFLEDKHFDIATKFIDSIVVSLNDINSNNSILEIIEEDALINRENLSSHLSDKLSNFLIKIKDEDNRVYYAFEQYSGLNIPRRNLHDIGTDLGITKERVRQLNDKFIQGFLTFSKVSSSFVSECMLNALNEFKDLENEFPELRTMFVDSDHFYLFLENISGNDKCLYPFIPNTESPIGAYSNRIFDQYCAYKKLPIPIDEAKKIISENNKCNDISTAFILFNQVKNKWIKLTENGIIPLSPSLSAMVAQSCLYFNEGASYVEIKNKVAEIFEHDFESERDSSAILQAVAFDYVYLYGDSRARHVSFFDDQYNEGTIDVVLDTVYDYVSNTNDKSCKVKQLYEDCFGSELNYYDLRHIVRVYGEKRDSDKIYFIGKSSQDLVYLDKDKFK